MATDNDFIARRIRSRSLPSLLTYGKQLSPEWKAAATTDQRIYFVNQRTRSTHWFPPPEFWASKLDLPYGWEAAFDNQNKKYYINHLTRITTREDPRSEADQAAYLHMTPIQAKRIELVRDATIGFGFVAGSEKPVVIRSVIPNGPSHDKLFANDQILKVNGKDVRDSPQADVISLIKGSVSRIELEVVASEDVQDTKNQHSRKSSLMSRTTRERRRSTPVSVRFADEPALVQVIGPMEPVRRSSVPLIPNVLKVFLENGQTRSFRYDCNTTAEDIFSSFASKLDMRLMEHFSLVLSGPKKGQVSYIQNHEKVSEIYTNRNCSSVNCLCKLNIAFVPKDHFELLSQDPNAFEYLYAQVTNRVVEGFYGVDLKYDLAIKLAALQIQQKAMEAAAGRAVKMSVRQVEKEFGGLGKFVSSDLLHNTRDKELRKILDQQIKQNENLASPGERHMSSLQCKIHYLNLAVEIFSYGGKYFDVVLVDDGNNGPSLKKSKKQDIIVIISLKYAVSQVVRGKVNVLCQLADFHEITGFKISVFEDNKRLLRIRLQEGKVIQLICTSLDCTDIIALITGYYKVYVDNTSNTPLPVENEEKWPFSFPRDPPANDAPEFYSRHRVVPDVWSYPSRFRTSNAKNKTQVENTTPLNSHEDLFIDLSRAPPRFHETVSEEPAEEHTVAEKVNWKKLDQDGNHEALAPLNATYEYETTEVSRQQDDPPQLAMTQDDRELLEKASSVLKSSTEDMNSINSEMQSNITYGGETDGDSEELNESCKRRPASSEISGEDDLGVKSPKLASTNDFQEDEEGLITELVLEKETWQNEEAGAIVVVESEGEVSVSDKESFSSMSTDGDNNWAVLPANSEELKAQMDAAVVERKEIDLSLQTTGQLSSENGSSESEHMNEEFESTGSVKNNLVVRPEHSATDVLSSSTDERTSLSAEDSGYLVSEFSDERSNLRLTLEQNSFISTDPFRDRSPTPSPSDLEFDESKFDNEGIELVDYVEGETASKGFDNQKSASNVLEKSVHQDSKYSDANKSQSGRDTANKARDLNDHNDGESSHIVSSEFVESSDTETASEMSDEDESLFTTFPEYFQPCRRLKYSGTKQGVLLLAEEDQDYTDGLNSAETNQDVALVSLKEFHAKDDLNSLSPASLKNAVDTSHEKDWEELSTASSESDECTYEVNAELASDDSEENWKEKKEGRKQEIHEHQDGTNGVPLPISLVSLDACFNDRRDVLLDTHSTLNANGLKVDESTQSFTADETVLSPPYDQMNFNANKSTAESVSREEPSTPPELSCRNDGSAGSNLLFDQSKNRDIFFQGFRTLNDPIDQNKLTWKDLHRSYSPSDWIVPSPPTPTPELDEDDIQIVPPPPSDPVTSEDELDKKLKDLIVPPPPSLTESVQTILSIRIASPPPSPTDIDHNEVDDFMYDYDEIRFLSLTDDHKLAHNNGLIPKQTLNSNFTEDRKIQAQKVETDASSVSKGRDYASKSISISQNTCKTNIPTKQSTTQYVPRERSFGSQAFLLNTSSSGLSILQDSRPTRQGIERRKDVLGEFPNIDMVNSSDLDNIDDINDKSMKTNKAVEVVHLSCNANHENISMESRSRVALRQKPPVPPKPRFSRTALNGSRTEKSDTIPNKNIVARPNTERVIKVEGNNNTPVTLTAHKEGMKAKPVEAGISLLGSQPQKESVFVDSNNNLKYHADTLSQVQTLNKSLAEVNEPGMRDSVNSSNFKARRSLDAAMELDFKKTTKRSETSKQHNSRGMGRSLSFTHRSPYVPSPYSPIKTSYPSQSSETNARESSHYTNCLSQVASPIVDSESPQGTFPLFRHTKPRLATPSVPAASRDEVFRLQRPPLKTNSSSRHDVNGNLVRNPCQDDYYHVLPKTSTERSDLQFPTDSSNLNTEHKECAYPVELHEDICDNLSPTSTPPPLPDRSPPPLPEMSPPKMIPGFDDHDFDFSEQLTGTCHDCTQSEGRERTTFDLPSSARELKTKRSSESLYHKRGNSTDNLLKTQGKICGSSSLSRSLTSTSFPRGVNRRSLSEDILSHKDVVAPTSETKRPSLCFGKPSNLGHVANSCSLLSMDEGETKSLRIKRSKVCEESMSKVSGFKKRLEAFLSGSTTSVTVTDETKNWPLVLQNNARFLACDVKVISSSVKRGSAQVVSAIRASLDSLEQLVESCEKVNAKLSETSTHNVRTLVSMVIEVLDHYGDIIATVKATTVERADDSDVESLVDKTDAMATIIASLIRTLRKY